MRILVSDNFASAGLDLLRSRAEVDYRPGLPYEELLADIENYDALVVRSGTRVTAEVIAAGSRLKVIGRAGVGVDNIDVPKATEMGIVVLNAPEGNTVSTAEHTIAMLASLARNIPAANHAYKAGCYEKGAFLGVELNRKVLGIIGLGRIGSEVARRAGAMGLKLLAYDPYISAERAEKVGAAMVPLERLLREADFITLHVPLIPATRHLLGEEQFALMKTGVRIINCARGGLIDEAVLYRALTAGKVAGAALDVFDNENPGENPLFQLDNVIVTPHLGASTREAQVNVALQVAEQVLKALAGEPVTSAVNVPGLSPEELSEVKAYLPLLHVLGSMGMQLFRGSVEEVEIRYSGEIAAKPLAPLSTSCMIGLLQVVLGDQVNYVNVAHIIQNRGIKVKEVCTSSSKNYTNLVSLAIRSGKKEYTIAGTLLNGEDIRIVQMGEYVIDVVPSRYMLVTTHIDRPGVVGKVGTILGNENINIASMQVGRQFIGGEAVMVLQVDDPIPERVLRMVNDLDVIASSSFVELKH